MFVFQRAPSQDHQTCQIAITFVVDHRLRRHGEHLLKEGPRDGESWALNSRSAPYRNLKPYALSLSSKSVDDGAGLRMGRRKALKEKRKKKDPEEDLPDQAGSWDPLTASPSDSGLCPRACPPPERALPESYPPRHHLRSQGATHREKAKKVQVNLELLFHGVNHHLGLFPNLGIQGTDLSDSRERQRLEIGGREPALQHGSQHGLDGDALQLVKLA